MQNALSADDAAVRFVLDGLGVSDLATLAARLRDADAFDRIVSVLDGAEWNADTTDEIGRIICSTGRELRDLGEPVRFAFEYPFGDLDRAAAAVAQTNDPSEWAKSGKPDESDFVRAIAKALHYQPTELHVESVAEEIFADAGETISGPRSLAAFVLERLDRSRVAVWQIIEQSSRETLWEGDALDALDALDRWSDSNEMARYSDVMYDETLGADERNVVGHDPETGGLFGIYTNTWVYPVRKETV